MNSHTEDEAKRKWCPAVRVPLSSPIDGSSAGTGNRHAMGGAVGLCIGSDCMWWQWDPHSAERTVQPRTQEEKIAAAKEASVPTRGYCGAAGR